MGLHFDVSNVEEAHVWVLDRLATESDEVKVQLAKTLWGI